MNDLTSQFVFPEEARLDIAERGGLRARGAPKLGVTQYEVGDFDKGIAYEFFVHQAKNDMASEEFDLELSDDVEMIRWIVTPRKHEPACRIVDLPPQLLKFRKVSQGKNIDGKLLMKLFRDEKGELECTGGLYRESYMRWRQGISAPGLSLAKWGKLTDSEIKTLVNEGVFSVQQFASMSESRVRMFPKNFQDRYKDAVHYTNAENPAVSLSDIKRAADQLTEQKQENAKLMSLVETLTERLEALEANSEPVKPKGKAKKAEVQ